MSISQFPEFDLICQETLEHAGDVTQHEKDLIVEELRLRFEHPGDYVAYIDKVSRKTQRVSRQIIGCSSNPKDLDAQIAQCSKQDQAKAVIDYLDPLEGDLQLPHDFTER